MRLTPSHIYSRYRPSLCDLRVFLRQRGAPEAESSPYEGVLKVLGRRHEHHHLETFPIYEDLSQITDFSELAKRTSIAIRASAPVIYQPLLKANITIGNVECEVIGRPDFLVRQEGGYKIRDSKMSRRINKKDHPEIILQMQLYGWLFQKDFPTGNFALEVHAGTGEIVPIPYDGDEVVLEELERIVQIAQMQSEPFSPVGLSKCGHCVFHDRCWQIAESNRSVALVPDLDQSLAIALYHQGTQTIAQLLQTFDETRLAEIKRPQGGKLKRVGNKAASILRNAQSLDSGKEIFLCNPWIQPSTNWVMFDLEGLPAHLDEWQKVYLWGMQVLGESPSVYFAATAGFGPEGEREGWFDFLRNAASVFETYGDIPFIHWATYEATLLKVYIDRFGDQSGVAARVQRNLVNLLPIVQTSFVLPLPSYSLKVIEKYVGFGRTQDEYGGDWSMAKYIEATETEDENLRNQVMEAIRTYNREDLEATWAVLQWLFSKRRTVEPLFSVEYRCPRPCV